MQNTKVKSDESAWQMHDRVRYANPYEAPGASDDEVQFVEVPDAGAAYRIGDRTVEALAGTQTWVRLIGWIALLIGLVSSLGTLAAVRQILHTGAAALPVAVSQALLTAIYIASGVLLLRYASSIADFTISRHIDHLDRALEAQRAFWRFLGIAIALIMILVLGLMLLLFSGAGAGAIWNLFD